MLRSICLALAGMLPLFAGGTSVCADDGTTPAYEVIAPAATWGSVQGTCRLSHPVRWRTTRYT